MGYFKQLHIDCYLGVCEANNWETCYQQPGNPAYFSHMTDGGMFDEEPQEPGEPAEGDRDDSIDQEQA